jgi:pimeloyl-ACP methyl ester carboxylesterase
VALRAGEDPLMLFLHGHPDSALLYESQLREFGRDHLAVAPNLRGYAPSDAPEAVEAYAMPRLLGDVHAPVRELPPARVGKGAALFQIRMNRTPRLVSLIRLGAAKPHTLV